MTKIAGSNLSAGLGLALLVSCSDDGPTRPAPAARAISPVLAATCRSVPGTGTMAPPIPGWRSAVDSVFDSSGVFRISFPFQAAKDTSVQKVREFAYQLCGSGPCSVGGRFFNFVSLLDSSGRPIGTDSSCFFFQYKAR